MTKKHFVALADLIRNQNNFPNTPNREKFTEYQIMILGNFCSSQNPNFNRSRWLAYIAGECGPNGGKVAR